MLQRTDVASSTYIDHLFGNVKGSPTMDKRCLTLLADKVVILIKIRLGKRELHIHDPNPNGRYYEELCILSSKKSFWIKLFFRLL